MPIQTVLGPIEADTLGVTSMHEHVFVDATVTVIAAAAAKASTSSFNFSELINEF